MNIGYIRVSTVDQNTGRQLEGITLNETFTDRVSGKSMDRPALRECLKFVRKGDILHVHSMDRLARNLMDLQKIVGDLTTQGIIVHFHKENLVFTNEANPMSTLMLQIMGAVAEFERSLIKERQLEGIKAAKRAGKLLGRRYSLTTDQLKEVRTMIDQGIPKTRIANHFNISRQSLYRNLERT